MDYTIFSQQFLVAAYLEARSNVDGRVRSGDLLEKYEFNVPPIWVHTTLQDWRSRGLISGTGVIGDERNQPISLTGAGLLQAEALLDDAYFQPLLRAPSPETLVENRAQSPFRRFEDQLLLALYLEWQQGRDLVTFARVVADHNLQHDRGWLLRAHDDLTAKGYLRGPVNRRVEEMTAGSLTPAGMEYVEDNLLPDQDPISSPVKQTAPAADRLVRLDHNSAGYEEIRSGISNVREAVRGINELEEEERDRLVVSLTAAESLWSATQLKVIQIKIGIILAIDDAKSALAGTAKAAAAALLVDAIKAFIRNHVGLDLDQI